MKAKKNFSHSKKLLLLGIVLILSISFLCMMFSTQSVFVFSQSKHIFQGFEIYLIVSNKSIEESLAKDVAKDEMTQGFAGYCWEYHNEFLTILTAHQNQNDALSMKENLRLLGKECEIEKIEFKPVNSEFATEKENQELVHWGFSAFQNAYEIFYDLSLILDTKVENELFAGKKVDEFLTKFENEKNSFDDVMKIDANSQTATLCTYIDDLHESISLLKNQTFLTPTQNYTSLLKYHYVEILNLYYNLVNVI